ncbi:MAG: protease inhibitor I9 family protein [Nitrosopumilus sp.]|nr:protease inhibitor I9 family protein [Nitrosopumilus sp.]
MSLVVTIILAGNSLATQVLAQEVKGGEIIPGQYIVLLEETEFAELVIQSYQLESITTYQYVFNGMAVAATEEQLSQLRDDPKVIAIEPDRIVIHKHFKSRNLKLLRTRD